MKNRIKLLVVCFACLAANCKYEDGPLISFVSLVHRIEGTYHVESATQNGQDQMDIIDELKVERLNFYWVEAEDDPGFNGGTSYGTLSATFKDSTSLGITGWNLESNNTEIEIGPFGCFSGFTPVQSYPIPGFLNNGTCEHLYWKIQRLTNKELCLSIRFAGDDYEVQLKEN